MESIHPEDYDLDAVRAAWIGKLISEARGRYPVEYDPIRRHCHMVGDLNPAFLDPEVAKSGPHGAVIVPPSMLPTYFAASGPWPPAAAAGTDPESTAVYTFGVPTPGDRGMNMEVAWDFVEPVRVGDHLRLELRIADVFQNQSVSTRTLSGSLRRLLSSIRMMRWSQNGVTRCLSIARRSRSLVILPATHQRERAHDPNRLSD